MPEEQTKTDSDKWHRWFAIECNNRAWRLSEAQTRSESEAAEMLAAAYAAAYHWAKIGTPHNIALADMLLGHVHAMRGDSELAMKHARATFDFVMANESQAWEVAFAHAVLAHAAAAGGDAAVHTEHYSKAKALGEALADEEERDIFNATFRQIPAPRVDQSRR